MAGDISAEVSSDSPKLPSLETAHYASDVRVYDAGNARTAEVGKSNFFEVATGDPLAHSDNSNDFAALGPAPPN